MEHEVRKLDGTGAFAVGYRVDAEDAEAAVRKILPLFVGADKGGLYLAIPRIPSGGTYGRQADPRKPWQAFRVEPPVSKPEEIFDLFVSALHEQPGEVAA